MRIRNTGRKAEATPINTTCLLGYCIHFTLRIHHGFILVPLNLPSKNLAAFQEGKVHM
jgi:hypothetical protein